MRTKPNRIPSLDGFRALSITMVLFGHMGNTIGFPHWLRFFTAYPALGVRIFFIISGFLITTLLLKEHEKNGKISLLGFYRRRAFRILPASLAIILVVTVVWHPKLSEILGALLFVQNYVMTGWRLDHFWSLAVEEQFYFLWPFLLVKFFPARKKIAIAGIILAPFARLIAAYFSHSIHYNMWFPCLEDTLATGCLLALVQPEMGKIRPWIDRFIIVLAIAPLVLLRLAYPHGVQPLLIQTLVNFSIVAVIDHCTRKPYWLLNCAPVVWWGGLSYSLYLCQQLFLVEQGKDWSSQFPRNIVFAIMAAIACHYLIEIPANRPNAVWVKKLVNYRRWNRDAEPGVLPAREVN